MNLHEVDDMYYERSRIKEAFMFYIIKYFNYILKRINKSVRWVLGLGRSGK